MDAWILHPGLSCCPVSILLRQGQAVVRGLWRRKTSTGNAMILDEVERGRELVDAPKRRSECEGSRVDQGSGSAVVFYVGWRI